jgi:YD repeat-containing protein
MFSFLPVLSLREPRRWWIARLALVAGLVGLTPTPTPADQVFDSWGFDQNRDYFSQLPYEHIDPMTGNLLLTFTDLVLPGNAGFDLRIQRTYNSKIYRDYNNSGDTLGADSWAGVGWTLLIARVLNPDPPNKPIIEMPDGSRHPTYNHVDGSGSFISRDFWVYRRILPAPVLSLPNGVTYTFGHRATIVGVGTVLLATEVRDPFGNRVTIEYAVAPGPPDGISRITQFIGGSSRQITFTYDSGLPRKSLRSITLNAAGRTFTWNYTQVDTNAVGYSLLTEVRPPVGPPWRHTYNTALPPRYELTRLVTPAGGQIDYTYADQQFSMPGTFIPIRSRVVTQRRTSGRDIPAGAWTYAYAQGANKNQSVFTSPCNRTTYTFLGIGNFAVGLPAWQIGLLSNKVTSEGANTLETESITWRASERISFDEEIIGFNRDFDIWVPLVDTRTVVRGSRNYVTRNTYNAGNFNDYGRPRQIAETGELSRTTDRTFRYGFVPYIVDKIATETVTVGGESFVKSYAYDLANGFLTSETLFGIPLFYANDGAGNVRSRRDALNNTTFFTYSWGLLKDTQTPLFTITRVINPEGTVASVTRRGFTTSFQYDALFRIVQTNPPVGNVLITEYDNAGGTFRRVRRGPSLVTTSLDGFGRVSGSSNAVGVNTEINYDACGRVVSTFAYDGANRLTSRTDVFGGRTFSTGYGYDGNDNLTEVRYPSLQRAVYSYDAGNRIILVTNGGATTYASLFQYHPSGAPTSFRAGNGLTHSFTYDNRYRLRILNSGAVLNLTYGYDRLGNVLSISDPRAGMSQTYGYDALDRLTSATGVWGGGSFSYDNLGNRLTKVIGGQSTGYVYSPGNQRLTSASGAEPDSFTYDANGNLIGRQGASFTYTPENMLELATVGPDLSLYRYDGDNLRKLKTRGGTSQYFIHGPGNQLLSEYGEPCPGQVRWVRDYIYAGTRLLAAAETATVETRVEFVAPNSSFNENAGNAPIGVRVLTSNNAPLLCPASVDYASADGTGTAGQDYTAVSGQLSFAAGTPSGSTRTINVPLLDDPFDEAFNEDFFVRLSNALGAVLGLSDHTVTIVDDDPTPGMTVGDVIVNEGHLGVVSAVFTVRLASPSSFEVRADFATADGTATAGLDYDAAAGTLVFPPASTLQTVAVTVQGDTLYEADETFLFQLQNLVNARPLDPDAVGTIRNDDPQPLGVPFFTATSTSQKVKLEWLNPPGDRYLATMIRYQAVAGASNCAFPPGPGDGQLLVSRAGAPGAYDSFVHEVLPNDNTTYCYAAFVELEPKLFTLSRTTKGRPFDTSAATKWSYSTGATTVAPPGLGPGVHAGSNDGILHLVTRGPDGGNWLPGGTPLVVGTMQSRPPVVPTALIAGASWVVFASSQNGHLYAVNAETGAELWRSARLGDAIQAATAGIFRAFGGAYDYLLVGTRNSAGGNTFYALNPVDGTLVGAPFDNGGGANGIGIISGGASVDYAGRRVFFASRALAGGSANTVWCLNLTDTGLAFGWAVALGDADGSPILSNGRLYVGTNDGMVYSLNPDDGQVLWSYATNDGPPKGFIFPDRRNRALYFSTTTKVHGLTDGNNEPNWPPVTLPSPSTALFTPGGTLILVGAADGKLYQLDVINAGPAVQPEIRSVTLGDGLAAVGSPTLDVLNRLIYVGTESGFIHAVRVPLQ